MNPINPDEGTPVSLKIRERLAQARRRFNANDNIADFIEPGELEKMLRGSAGLSRAREVRGDLAARDGDRQAVVNLLESETAGNAFFIVEVLRVLAEEAGALNRIGSGRLPSQVMAGGVQAVLLRRLGRVPVAARRRTSSARTAGGATSHGGLLGGVIAAWATFVPSFIWIFAGAPYIERLRGNRLLSAALSAITAAVVGVILNLAVWFALHVIFTQVEPSTFGSLGPLTLSLPQPVWSSLDWQALAIAIISALMIFRFHLGIGKTLIAAGLMGLAARFLL